MKLITLIKQPFYVTRGILSSLCIFLNLLILPSVVLVLTATNWIFPLKSWRHMVRRITRVTLPKIWTGINNLVLNMACIRWDIHADGELKKAGWYALISNHQSWADILILERAFAGKTPKLKFFMKQSLLWQLPVCGLACWAMGYPFVKRYTRQDVRKNPNLKTKSIEDVRKVSRELLDFPTVIVNFLEGTRFTPEKQKVRQSPYQHLLQPNAMGLSLVLDAMHPQLDGIIDATIIYPEKRTSLWALLSGQINQITVHYKVIVPDEAWFGDYPNDANFRKQFRQLINPLWQAKEEKLAQ